MASVTLSVLEGLERGRIYRNLQTPITIGREESNSVQLNDERISRLHAKLQDDQGAILFTDLHSTNGSRVNGHAVQLRVLRPGDQLQLGRCTLLFGSPEEILQQQMQMQLRPPDRPDAGWPSPGDSGTGSWIGGNVPGLGSWSGSGIQPGSGAGSGAASGQSMPPLFSNEKPPLPDGLSTLQRARLSDLLMYVHESLQLIISESREVTDGGSVVFERQRFEKLLLLQRDLAVWVRNAAGVGDEESP